MNIPDVPCLKDGSTMVGALSERDSTIVMYCMDRVRSFVAIFSMFPLRILENHNRITYRVGVGNAFSILPFVILDDKALLAFLNIFPVCFETYIE